MSTTYDTYANLSFGFGIAATILGCGCLGVLEANTTENHTANESKNRIYTIYSIP